MAVNLRIFSLRVFDEIWQNIRQRLTQFWPNLDKSWLMLTEKIAKIILCEQFEIGAVQTCANLGELEKCYATSTKVLIRKDRPRCSRERTVQSTSEET